MKQFILLLILFCAISTQAQTNGSIAGTLTDKEIGNQPLPFASVIIKGTTKGTTSDFDGNYIIDNVASGTYSLEISFVGYETKVISDVVVIADQVTTISTDLGASAAALDEVIIKTTSRKESVAALLLDQRNATTIKESIGATELAKQAISNVADAAAKISGVSKSEGSGDVFVRGLGDRYLTTTLNGLPIPSDDIERKNIDLGLFPTRLIENVSISKTFSAMTSADQASGNVNITSRELKGSEQLSVNASTSLNSNVANDAFDSFKTSVAYNDVTAGIYVKKGALSDNVISDNQTWDTGDIGTPINRSVSVNYGKQVGERLRLLASFGQSASHEYRSEEFRQFRGNFIDDTIPDAVRWTKKITTSGLLSGKYKLSDDKSDAIKFTAVVVNKIEDQVYEGGRNGSATIFEETDDGAAFQFIRDQNLKKTLLSITQLTGVNELSAKNKLDWAVGYNFVSADEPNRVRNELNFNFTDPEDAGLIQLGRNGGFQQRKSNQQITDNEINGRIMNATKFIDDYETGKLIELHIGANFRNKTRDFRSKFYGITESFTNAVNPTSLDNLSTVFSQLNLDNNLIQIQDLPEDLYDGKLQSLAGFADFVGRFNKFTLGAGLRYQSDNIDVNWNVNNFSGRIGSTKKSYDRIYPALNLKYEFNDKQSLRLASSITTTLPEFKEIAPFEYVSPQGQITVGNPTLEASKDFNIDLKYEFFPSRRQILSLTAFYKDIQDPINKVQERGSAGRFSYFNSGEKAEVYGLEFEGRIDLLKQDEDSDLTTASLKLNLNATRMWHTQDLKDNRTDSGGQTFQYKGITETNLQGASDWIVNTSINFSDEKEFPLDATLALNYASDKIFALGSPSIQSSSDINYNDAIVENGFVTLDITIRKQLNKNWRLGLTGKNLLDPKIKRTQLVRPSTTGIETNETVLSYTKGVQVGFNINYSF